MQFRRLLRSMGSTRLAISCLIASFRGIWIVTIRRGMLTLRSRLWGGWRRLQLILWGLTMGIWIKKDGWIIFRFLDWISWLIRSSDLGLSRSMPILVSRPAVLCYRGSSLWWSSILWDWDWTLWFCHQATTLPTIDTTSLTTSLKTWNMRSSLMNSNKASPTPQWSSLMTSTSTSLKMSTKTRDLISI